MRLTDDGSITTPINWVKGDDVIVHPSVTNEEAKVRRPFVQSNPPPGGRFVVWR